MWTLKSMIAFVCVASVLCQTPVNEGMPAPVKRVYRSAKVRDPLAARRVALALGPGHHVLTRVRTGRTYRGHIEMIEEQNFTLRLDRSRQSIAIPYAEIDHLEQNLSLRAKIGIAAAIAGTVGFLIYWRTVIDHDE